MNIIIDSPLYKQISEFKKIRLEQQQEEEQEELEQEPENTDYELTQQIGDVINPPNKKEQEQIQQINSMVQDRDVELQQNDGENEENNEDETDKSELIYAKQVRIYEKIVDIKLKLMRNRNSIINDHNNENFNTLLYDIDHVLEFLYTFQYPTQLKLLELIVKETSKLK